MPTQAQKGGAGIAPTHSKPQRYKGVGNQRHAPAALLPEKTGTHYTGGYKALFLA